MEDEWTIVIGRRSKGRSRKPRPSLPKTTAPCRGLYPHQPPLHSDDDDDHLGESLLLTRKVEASIKKLQESSFFSAFLDQLQSPPFRTKLDQVLGSHPLIKMVVYGIGSIASCERARLQFAFAVLLRRALGFVAGIEVFDPVISPVESKVMESFDFSMIPTDEQGRRVAHEPTLFFMPHCEAVLYNNLLEANWGSPLLKRIVVLGNSFSGYEQFVSEFRGAHIAGSTNYIIGVREHTEEIEVKVDEEFFLPFHDTSWHFFELGSDSELPIGV
ncbi:protein SENSITIVITY TO RED LIGHT REDUCED 1 [Nymphaea colorata]|uniref:protein SENSITIVITY TO RED LIGHT REDUCED 1 n=1 Tax=Nymphaea colorata TaxID=210225 RepID=UPI00129DA8C0|nr:protein SENSITIVITY TO RED LIGHT REDUCED 1 [Nymphaea colorata]